MGMKAKRKTEFPKIRVDVWSKQRLDDLRGSRSYAVCIHDLLEELTQLRESSTGLVEPIPKETVRKVDCLALIEVHGQYYCCKHAPNFKKIPSLRLCEGCPRPIVEKKALTEKETKPIYYRTCGSEVFIGKDGKEWLKCNSGTKGGSIYGIRPEDCIKAKCRWLKQVMSEKI